MNDANTSSKQRKALLRSAERALEAGNASLAFELFSRYLNDCEENQTARYGAALSAARIGSITVSERYLQPLLEHDLANSQLRIDCLSLLGRLEKDRFNRLENSEQKRQAALRSANAYSAAFEESQDYYPGTNAATMFLLGDETTRSAALVAKLLPDCLARLSDGETKDPWLAATLGELFLLKDERTKAEHWYQTSAALMPSAWGSIATIRRQLRLLSCKKHMAADLLSQVKIPAVATVTGHMIDQPGTRNPRFPTELEKPIRAEINAYLRNHNIGIAYCSAACGVDILFAEELLGLGGELHVYLPFSKTDFIETSVAFAGDDWVARMETILARATSVKFATHENYLGDDVLFAYNADVLSGHMLLRAQRLEVEPRFLAVYDFASATLTGGARATADSWEANGHRVDRIDISPLRESLGPTSASANTDSRPASPSATNPRAIHAMVFADIVGFSKLGEAETPHFFVNLLNAVADLISQHSAHNQFRNTWGDGLFLVFDQLTAAAAFALDLRDLVVNTEWSEYGLPSSTNIRIALHVGPVYPANDPVLQCNNFFGSHVNQTARMEPITSPGSVFVSDQAAALIRFQAKDQFACDYLGPATLPKGAGTIGVHRLRWHHEIE